MADAQDLKFEKSHFPAISYDCLRFAQTHCICLIKSIFAAFSRVIIQGEIPTLKVAQKAAQKFRWTHGLYKSCGSDGPASSYAFSRAPGLFGVRQR